ncbi:AraC family transcriptional regulator [Marinomonas sp. 2405UD68-3]|uniref:helix-turn-helix transcriptional regulator n=1 Tax=Marinomonas sp. 2405UD68-3 TaxID=3391835 RepID=UPI0039C9A666
MSSIIPDVQFKNSELSRLGFEVVCLDNVYAQFEAKEIKYIDKPHRIHFYNIIIITDGQGVHSIDFNQFQIEKGRVLMINKGQIHAFDLVHKPKGKLIIFTDTFIDKVATAINLQIFSPTYFISSNLQGFTLSTRQESTLLELISLLNIELEIDTPNIEFLQTLFTSMLLKITEARPNIYRNPMNPLQTRCFERFIGTLNETFTQTRDAHYYAHLLGITYKTLNKICKLATNRTAKQLIDAHTILEAKRRLSIDNYQIQQLAEYLGFDEPSNFVKYFKKHTLMTPSQFKKSR